MAHRLGNDLAKVENGDCRGQKAGESAEDVGGDNRERGVDGGVTDKQRAEEEVGVLAHGQDFAGVVLLLLGTRLGEHTQIDDAQRHEAQREAGERARQHEAHGRDNNSPPCNHFTGTNADGSVGGR